MGAMISLLIISLSRLLSSRAFTRDMIKPFSEARFTNSWKYAIAGLTYCEVSIFIFRYLLAIPFASLREKFYNCMHLQKSIKIYKDKSLCRSERHLERLSVGLVASNIIVFGNP